MHPPATYLPPHDPRLVVPATRGPLVACEGEHTVVWLEGECDIATLPADAGTLAKAISLGGADVIVDLSRVTFLGAATINALVQSRNTLHRQSRGLTLRLPSPIATRVLLLCQLNDLLEPTRRILPFRFDERIGRSCRGGPS